MDGIMRLAERHSLAVIEDSCHANGVRYEGSPGSPYHGRFAGTIGDIGCFSIYANKNMANGDGGMVVRNDEKLATRVRLGRSHGMTRSGWDKASGRGGGFDIVQLGFNYRCTEIMAALGLVQFAKLPAANRQRAAMVRVYRERLADVLGLTIPFAPRMDSAHHIIPVLLADPADQPTFREALLEKGIQTGHHYPAAHLFAQYRDRPRVAGTLQRTEDVAAREVTLPLHALLSADDVQAICDGVLECLPQATRSGATHAHP
jgi:dTDP-4-amino-4,6-dideoxygalactose transaminase